MLFRSHLNLTELIACAGNQAESPQDLESTYNEKGQTVKSIATASKATWYDKDIYENTNNYIKITYPNNTLAVTSAGEYWTKIEITQSYIDAINKQVDDEGVANGWSSDYIAQVKENRKPKFKGTADTTDPEHLE